MNNNFKKIQISSFWSESWLWCLFFFLSEGKVWIFGKSARGSPERNDSHVTPIVSYIQFKSSRTSWRVTATLEVRTPPRGFLKIQLKKKESTGANAETDRQRDSETYRDTGGTAADLLMWVSAGLCVARTRQACWGKGISTAAHARVSPPELLLPPWASKTHTCVLKRPKFTQACTLLSSGCAKAKKHELVHVDPVWAGSPEVSMCFCSNKNKFKCKFVHFCCLALNNLCRGGADSKNCSLPLGGDR